jgi:hypothetical protein
VKATTRAGRALAARAERNRRLYWRAVQAGDTDSVRFAGMHSAAGRQARIVEARNRAREHKSVREVEL